MVTTHPRSAESLFDHDCTQRSPSYNWEIKVELNSCPSHTKQAPSHAVLSLYRRLESYI